MGAGFEEQVAERKDGANERCANMERGEGKRRNDESCFQRYGVWWGGRSTDEAVVE